MKRAFSQIKKHWIINLVTFVISLLVGGGIFCLVFFLKNKTILDAVDAATVACFVVLAIGLLLLAIHNGAFDMFTFGFKQLGNAIFSKDPRKDSDFYEYRDAKTEKRINSSYNFLAIILAGLLLLIAVIVLEIVYHATI